VSGYHCRRCQVTFATAQTCDWCGGAAVQLPSGVHAPTPTLRGRTELPHTEQLYSIAVMDGCGWRVHSDVGLKMWEALEFSHTMRAAGWETRIGPVEPV
jgi:hypothetical protein